MPAASARKCAMSRAHVSDPSDTLLRQRDRMHTLGATDRYDAAGRTLVPDGLAEVVPGSIDELAVGARTATEIGWLR